MEKIMAEHCIAQYFGALRSMDETTWVGLFATGGALHDPADAAPLVGDEALRGFFRMALGAFETLSLTTDSVFVCGNQAAVRFRGEGRGKNGRDVRFEGIDLFEFDADGRIRSVRGYWEPGALFAQLQAG